MKRVIALVVRASLSGLAIAFYFAWSGLTPVTTAQAASLPGTATLSGTVDSAKPFKAAQVYIRNPEKRMVYMVYTVGGHYEASQIFPGDYEVSVATKGLQNLGSDVQKISLKAGQKAAMNLSMHEVSAKQRPIEYLTFNEIYPQGPGRAVLQRTCVYCHGENFLPSKHNNEKQWNDALNYMTGKDNPQGAMIQPKDMSLQDRAEVLAYLVANFGPDSKLRAVKVQSDMPVDEAKVAHAEYIEFYFPDDPPGQGVNDPKYKKAGEGDFSAGRRMGQDPQLDGEGNVWVTDRGIPNRIVKLDPRTGEMKEWLTPEPQAGNHDLEIDRKNGLLWMPEDEGVPAGNLRLRSFNIKTEKWVGDYLGDPKNVITNLKHMQSLTFDSKGNIFYVFILGGAIGKWNRETKQMTTYPIPTPNSFPYGIVTDKFDNIWIAEFHGSKLAKFDTKTNQFTEYNPPTQPALIRRLNVDSDGQTIWTGLFSGGKLERLDPTTGKFTEWKIPQQVSQPYDFQCINGQVWFSDAGQGGAIIHFDPKAETFTYYPSPQIADMPKIRITKEGAIWYSPRSSRDHPGLGVLYPDITKITTLAALPR